MRTIPEIGVYDRWAERSRQNKARKHGLEYIKERFCIAYNQLMPAGLSDLICRTTRTLGSGFCASKQVSYSDFVRNS